MNWYKRLKTSEVKEKNLGMMRNFSGLSVNVENQAGTDRVGSDKDGKEWRNTMDYDYGFIYATKGSDGEGIDVYLGPDENAENVYIIHQNDPKTGEYDEDKFMLGFQDGKEAKKEYLKQYDSSKFFGSITELNFKSFSDIVNNKSRERINWKKKGHLV